MRCVACDVPLTQKEESMKSPITGEDYLLCTKDGKAAGLAVYLDIVEDEGPPPVEEDAYTAISGLDEIFTK